MCAGCLPVYLHVFAAYEPAHRCFIPSCDSANSQLNEHHITFSIPREDSFGHMFTEAEHFDPCKRFDDFGSNISSLTNILDNMTCTEEEFDQVIFVFSIYDIIIFGISNSLH